MLYKIIVCFLYIVIGGYVTASVPVFRSWPNAVGSYRGQSATLTWTLDQPVTTTWRSIQLFYNTTPEAKLICTWYGILPNKFYYNQGYDGGKATVDIMVGSRTVNLTINHLQDEDVTYNYICKVRLSLRKSITDRQGWILLYDVPSSPRITRSTSDVVENRVFTMRCSARSTSILPSNLPTDLKPIMEYRWQRDKQDLTNDGRHRVSGEAGNTLTIDKIQREDNNITYTCTAQESGSKISRSMDIALDVMWPAQWYKVYPENKVRVVSVGSATSFKIWIKAHPLPEQDQWQWKFSPSNSSNVMTTNPGYVRLTISGHMAVLSITNVTVNHYGNYYIWTNNKYGGWNEGDLAFRLLQQGPPHRPIDFKVIDVTAVSIRVQWRAGFNGGLEQTFTIRYTNVATGVVMETSGIEDRGVTDRQMITDDITDGIEPETGYQLQIFAVNLKGQTTGGIVSTVTPVLAKFREPPDIKIYNNRADIHFIIIGPLTHIRIENCVEGTHDCVTKNVMVPQETRIKRQTSRNIYDFKTEVALANPRAKSWLFSFWMYDDDVVLYSEPTKMKVNNGTGITLSLTGAVVGILLILVIIIILIVLWRKGILNRDSVKVCQSQNRMKDEETSQGLQNPSNPEEHQYEMTNLPQAGQIQVSAVYQTLQQTEINIFSSSEIIIDSLLSEGNMYQVWKGKLPDKYDSMQVAIKKVIECNDVCTDYLEAQGQYMTKLRSSDYILDCLGMTSDYKLLVMELAPLGNLKQFLESRTNETYYNVTSSQSMEMNFINQIIEGVEAVHQLDPPGLFYCLCASNVLLSGDTKCKLTGFGSVESVRAREKWEEENNLPRPIQWLSPEAIKLNHIIQSDVWSFGILMWEIFTRGSLPFGDVSNEEARQKVLNGQKPLKPTNCSEEIFDIMTQCWLRLPYNRLTVQEIKSKCYEITEYEEV